MNISMRYCDQGFITNRAFLALLNWILYRIHFYLIYILWAFGYFLATICSWKSCNVIMPSVIISVSFDFVEFEIEKRMQENSLFDLNMQRSNLQMCTKKEKNKKIRKKTFRNQINIMTEYSLISCNSYHQYLYVCIYKKLKLNKKKW